MVNYNKTQSYIPYSFLQFSEKVRQAHLSVLEKDLRNYNESITIQELCNILVFNGSIKRDEINFFLGEYLGQPIISSKREIILTKNENNPEKLDISRKINPLI